jgi:hypothetical protein
MESGRSTVTLVGRGLLSVPGSVIAIFNVCGYSAPVAPPYTVVQFAPVSVMTAPVAPITAFVNPNVVEVIDGELGLIAGV